MSVWLTLFGAIFGTVGLLAGFYLVVIGLVEGRRAKAKPRLGIAGATHPGCLTFWVTWEPEVFAIQVYRLRVQLANPHGDPQESTFTVTYDPPQKTPFQQEVMLPQEIRDVVEKSTRDALLTIDFRTVEELTVPVVYHLTKIRNVYQSKSGKIPSGLTKLPDAQHDPATVFSLSYEELVARRKKLKDLEAAAKAKAAKAPPAKPTAAAAPTPPSTPSGSSGSSTPPAGGGTPPPSAGSADGGKMAAAPVEKKAPMETQVPTTATANKEAPAPAPAPAQAASGKPGAPLPSLKDLIAQVNAKVKEGDKPNSPTK